MESSSSDFLHKHKQLIGPVILLFLAGFIVLRVIIPMFSTISEERAKLADAKIRVEKLTDTQNTIQQINADNINENIDVSQQALPMNKDIIQIYTNVVEIAGKNNIEVKTFSVKVGQVYSKDGSEKQEPKRVAEAPEFPTLDINLGVDAPDTKALFQFSQDMMRSLPLASVTDLSADGADGQYDISFYYKPLNTGQLAEQEYVTPLNETEQKSLETIKEFEQN